MSGVTTGQAKGGRGERAWVHLQSGALLQRAGGCSDWLQQSARSRPRTETVASERLRSGCRRREARRGSGALLRPLSLTATRDCVCRADSHARKRSPRLFLPRDPPRWSCVALARLPQVTSQPLSLPTTALRHSWTEKQEPYSTGQGYVNMPPKPGAYDQFQYHAMVSCLPPLHSHPSAS